MSKNLLVKVKSEFEDWENSPPNIINEGFGKLTAPIAFALNPVVNKLAPKLEGVVSSANNFIASAIDNVDKAPDFENLDEESFKKWFANADVSAKNWRTAGVTAIGAGGGAAGLFGIVALLVEIPASFGLILSFANKIALTYGLPIKTEEVQIAILNAITVGSANNLNEKTVAIANLKLVETTLNKSWKEIYRIAADNIISPEAIIKAVRELLGKMGINITKRKAGQIVPAIGAAVGATINAAWAADALEAVRQYSRHWIVEMYNRR